MTTIGPQPFSDLSPSAWRALRSATAAAANRGGPRSEMGGPTVDAADLLVGILVAHPDPDGEVRVLLDHFGLTVRDILPPDYPAVSIGRYTVEARRLKMTPCSPAGRAQRPLPVAPRIQT